MNSIVSTSKTSGVSKTSKQVPNLSDVLSTLVLPDWSVFLGLATDGLPVLLDVSNKKALNVMVWDRVVGQGLKLLKTAIEYILKHKDQKRSRTEFVILSNNTNEWLKLTNNELGVWDRYACVAVVPFWDRVADQVLAALASWCYGHRGSGMPVILFIDGLENLEKMSKESKENLMYVLSNGRKKNIYVIGTAKSENRAFLASLLEYFQREIYGQDSLYWFEMDDNTLFFAPKTVL